MTDLIIEPSGRFATSPVRLSAVHTIGRGLEEVPVLRHGLGVTWLLAGIGAVGRVVVPVLLQQAIDRGIVGEESVRVDLVSMLAAVAAVALIISGIAQRQAVVRLGTRSEEALYQLRGRLIGHIHRLSLADHNEERRGALVARVTSDIETLAQFFQWAGITWLLNGPLMLLVGAVMLAYDWVLALVAFALAAPLALVLRIVQRRLVAAYEAVRERNGEMMATIGEVVGGAESIRAYDAGSAFGATAVTAVDRRKSAQIRAALIGSLLFPSGEVFATLTVCGVITIGVIRGPASGLTAGAMVGFLFLTYRFLEPIGEFTEVFDQTQTAVAGLRRVLGVLDMPTGPPPTDRPVPLPPGELDVGVRNVTFAYPTRGITTSLDEAVLRDVDVTIPAGQQVALVGATGSGKTTLGRLIARFADPTVGELVSRRRAAAVRRQRRVAPAPGRRIAGAVPLRRHDRRQRRLRQAGDITARHRGDGAAARAGGLGQHAQRRADDARRRTWARTSQRGSASSSPSCAPVSPTPTCSSSTRRRRRSTR